VACNAENYSGAPVGSHSSSKLQFFFLVLRFPQSSTWHI